MLLLHSHLASFSHAARCCGVPCAAAGAGASTAMSARPAGHGEAKDELSRRAGVADVHDRCPLRSLIGRPGPDERYRVRRSVGQGTSGSGLLRVENPWRSERMPSGLPPKAANAGGRRCARPGPTRRAAVPPVKLVTLRSSRPLTSIRKIEFARHVSAPFDAQGDVPDRSAGNRNDLKPGRWLIDVSQDSADHCDGCAKHDASAIELLRRSASRFHRSRLSMMRSMCAMRNSSVSRASFSIARACSSSMRSSTISRRIAGTGSATSNGCGAGIMRMVG